MVVLLSVGLLGASPAMAQSSPSMNLEGSGLIAFSTGCSATTCAGTFRFIVSGVLGQQSVKNLNLTLNFEVPVLPQPPTSATAAKTPKKPKKPTLQQQINALQESLSLILPPRCLPASGTGTSSDGAYTITFNGEFCSLAENEGLSGAISIVSTAAPMPPNYDVAWASGTLSGSGLPRCCGGPTPNISEGIIVSIVGALGQEYEGP